MFFPPLSLPTQIQQMADNIAADIDKHLAAKTKELLGWLWSLLFVSLWNRRHSKKQQHILLFFHLVNRQWLDHVGEVVFVQTTSWALVPAHITGYDHLFLFFSFFLLRRDICINKNWYKNDNRLPVTSLLPCYSSCLQTNSEKATNGLLMGFVGLLLIKPFATGPVCLYKSKRTRLNVNWLRVCLGGKSKSEFVPET